MVAPIWIALGVPVIFILVGATGRKLVRGTGWQRSDFYLGPQLCLATLSADILFLADLFREPMHGVSAQRREINAIILLAAVFFLYIVLLALQQDWHERHNRPKTQLFWLVVLSNLIGGGLFVSFVFLVKEGP
jgi:hypothetical protein